MTLCLFIEKPHYSIIHILELTLSIQKKKKLFGLHLLLYIQYFHIIFLKAYVATFFNLAAGQI